MFLLFFADDLDSPRFQNIQTISSCVFSHLETMCEFLGVITSENSHAPIPKKLVPALYSGGWIG
jgi:hypothetical protein